MPGRAPGQARPAPAKHRLGRLARVEPDHRNRQRPQPALVPRPAAPREARVVIAHRPVEKAPVRGLPLRRPHQRGIRPQPLAPPQPREPLRARQRQEDHMGEPRHDRRPPRGEGPRQDPVPPRQEQLLHQRQPLGHRPLHREGRVGGLPVEVVRVEGLAVEGHRQPAGKRRRARSARAQDVYPPSHGRIRPPRARPGRHPRAADPAIAAGFLARYCWW
jgi:hypothetical protein